MALNIDMIYIWREMITVFEIDDGVSSTLPVEASRLRVWNLISSEHDARY